MRLMSIQKAWAKASCMLRSKHMERKYDNVIYCWIYWYNKDCLSNIIGKKKNIQGITVEILWTYVRLYQLMEELVTCKWLNLMWRTENEPWRSELKKEILYKDGLLGNEKTLSYFALRWAVEWLVDLSLKDDQRNDLFPLPWRMQWKWKLSHCVMPHRYVIIPIWILIPVLIIHIPEMSKCHRDFVWGMWGHFCIIPQESQKWQER